MAPVPVALPQTIGDATTDLNANFTAEASVGVKLDTIVDDPGGTPYSFITTLIDATVEYLDGRLWELDYTLEGEATEAPSSPASPKDAATFAAFDVTADEGLTAYGANPAALMFRWTGVPMVGATDTLQVELTCLLRTSGSRQFEWKVAVTREGTPANDASIDSVVFPIIRLKGPTELNASYPTHIECQKQSRFLWPTTALGLAPFLAKNSDLWLICNTQVEYEATLPQPMSHQFLSTMTARSTDPGYLKAFTMLAEDNAGNRKAMGFRGRNQANDGYISLWFRHLPKFLDANNEKSDYGNVYTSPYYTMTAVVTCLNNSWWWYVCKHYRDRMLAIGGLPPLLEDVAGGSELSQDWVDGAMYVGHVQLLAKTAGQEYADACLKSTQQILSILDTDKVSSRPAFLHMQTYQFGGGKKVQNLPFPYDATRQVRGTAGVGLTEEFDEGRLDEGLAAMNKEAIEDQIYPSVYTRPTALLIGRHGYVVPSRLIRRDGRFTDGTVNSEGMVNLDVQLEEFLAWWRDKGPASAVIAAGYVGIYLDVFAAQGTLLTYPNDPDVKPKHGGDALTKQAFVTGLRDFFKANPPHGAPASAVTIHSEAFEEPTAGGLDVKLEHYHYYYGNLGQRAEQDLRVDLGAIPNVNDFCRELHPMLHAAVMGDRDIVVQLTPTLTNNLLATNTDWNPSNALPGLSEAEFLDFWCCCLAGIFISGQRFALNVNQDGQQDLAGGPKDSLWLPGQKNRDASEKDPGRAGNVVMQFLRTLYEAQKIRGYAGQAVRLGSLECPFFTQYGASTRKVNPFSNLTNFDFIGDNDPRDGSDAEPPTSSKRTPRTFTVGLGQYNNPASSSIWQYAYGTSDVYQVLSSVWRTPAAPAPGPNDRLVLVLVNWSSVACEWECFFNTAHYGFGGAVTVTERLPDLSTVVKGSAGPGTITVGTYAVDNIVLDTTIAPRTVRVFEIT